MQEPWQPIEDREGRKGQYMITSDASRVIVRLDSGERLTMPRQYVVEASGGGSRFQHAFTELLAGSELVIPVHAEQLEISKRSAPREQVRVSTHVSEREETVDQALLNEELKIERVTVDRVVEQAVAPRQEGDTWIVPVYEEVLFVEKRLLLREEVHIQRVRRERHQPQQVRLRREEVEVVRTKLDDSTADRKVGGAQ